VNVITKTRAGPKQNGAGYSASQELRLLLEDYHLIAALQAPLEFVFWALAQHKTKLANKPENRGFKV
jgi:hypothetical protein